jgi:hypothetical protein
VAGLAAAARKSTAATARVRRSTGCNRWPRKRHQKRRRSKKIRLAVCGRRTFTDPKGRGNPRGNRTSPASKHSRGKCDPIEEIQNRIKTLQTDLQMTREKLAKETEERRDLATNTRRP